MNLYTFFIYGYKYYAVGSLTQNEIEKIEAICKEVSSHSCSSGPQSVYERILQQANSVVPITVEHIFRINQP